jgi:hypothetical protein
MYEKLKRSDGYDSRAEPITSDPQFMSWLVDSNYAVAFDMADGRWCGIHPLMYHWTMHIGVIGDRQGYEDRYCFVDQATALRSIVEWQDRGFQDEPKFWRKHPKTDRWLGDLGS